MKRYLLFLLALMLLVAAGCDQQQNPTTPDSAVSPNAAAKLGVAQKVDWAAMKAKLEGIKTTAAPLIAAHKAKLAAKTPAERSGAQGIEATLVVPDAFATIQDAVDAAAPGDKITVKASGSPYSEVVIVTTPDLRIVASGTVTLLGAFVIGGVDDVSIEGFIIEASVVGFGIAVIDGSGGKIKDNTVNGAFASLGGIALLDDCTNNTVEDNVCNRNFVGIFVGPLFAGLPAKTNLVKENKCWENFAGIIVADFYFTGANNGNRVNENNGNWNVEIGIGVFASNNNELQANNCNNNGGPGFVVDGVSTGNIIRPDNSAKKNGDHGIILGVDTVNNKVKENTFTANTPCDILDLGTGNDIKNNAFDCKTP